jgi:hypothetical protein
MRRCRSRRIREPLGRERTWETPGVPWEVHARKVGENSSPLCKIPSNALFQYTPPEVVRLEPDVAWNRNTIG